MFRFTPEVTIVDAGQRIRFVDDDQDNNEPHTATIVNQADLPTSFAGGDACFAETAPCGQALAAHDPDGDHQPPFNLVVNKGRPGLDRPGDSLLFGGGLDNQSISARVTAAPGTTPLLPVRTPPLDAGQDQSPLTHTKPAHMPLTQPRPIGGCALGHGRG